MDYPIHRYSVYGEEQEMQKKIQNIGPKHILYGDMCNRGREAISCNMRPVSPVITFAGTDFVCLELQANICNNTQAMLVRN